MSIFRLRGTVSRIFGSSALTPLMTSSVDTEPFFRIVISDGIGAVDPHHIGLRRGAEMRIGDVADEYRGAVDDADRQIVQLVQAFRRPVEIDDIFEAADLLRPDGRDDVLPADRVDDILRREPVSLQLVLVDVHLDLKDLASVGRGNCGAGDGRKLRADEVLAIVEDLRLRQRLARQRELDDRTLEALKLSTKGGVIPGGRNFRTVCEAAVVCGERGVDVDAALEEHLDDPVARHGLRLDMLDVVDLRAQRALVIVDDALRHVVGRQAVVGPHHRDDGNADRRERCRSASAPRPSTPKMTMSIAITTNVYGLLSAIRTIASIESYDCLSVYAHAAPAPGRAEHARSAACTGETSSLSGTIKPLNNIWEHTPAGCAPYLPLILRRGRDRATPWRLRA